MFYKQKKTAVLKKYKTITGYLNDCDFTNYFSGTEIKNCINRYKYQSLCIIVLKPLQDNISAFIYSIVNTHFINAQYWTQDWCL